MALADSSGVMSLVNAAMCQLLGRSATELTGKRLTDIGLVARAEKEAIVGEATRAGSVEYWCERPDGTHAHLEVTATPITDGRRQVLQLRDVTEERDAVRRLQHLASHDPGTEVGNRSLLIERLSAALGGPGDGSDSGLALLFVDLDGFKRVNDVHSHATGDHVLRVIAQRLARMVRPVDTVARWGGDEFIVLVDGLQEDAAALALVRRIQKSICQQIIIDDTVVTVSSSVGVVFSRPGDILGVEDLLRHADAAMYVSKRQGRNRYSVFDASAHTA
jgi:diguanylate cyclase (GGDEF)-like protein/PAS domain S-box-containing protein